MRLSKYTSFVARRQLYLICFESCLIVSLATFLILFNIPLPSSPPTQQSFVVAPGEVLHLDTIVIPAPVEDIPAPPPPVVPEDPVPDQILEEHLQDLDPEFLPSSPLPLPPAETDLWALSLENALVTSENLPQLIGGIPKLKAQINYPPKALKDKVEGRVIVQFIIDRKGRVRNPKVLKGVRDDLDREAVRAISRSRFRPGRLNGKTIPVEQVIHVVFKIKYHS